MSRNTFYIARRMVTVALFAAGVGLAGCESTDYGGSYPTPPAGEVSGGPAEPDELSTGGAAQPANESDAAPPPPSPAEDEGPPPPQP